MTGELRAQRLETCRWGYEGGPCIWDADEPSICEGCNGDGTRWVTVGTLRQSIADETCCTRGGTRWTFSDDGLLPVYVIEEQP